ncbi:MAG TPA: HlyD family type I secretion periplasmic adaptor subunit [Ferrovibrio sp.]|uniref:HlyD family type I secretion periplasmic adaptor subunit n=1 Tax=Ferrovibrio sp. TaxID=1917215 RepID=UPI002ED6AA19
MTHLSEIGAPDLRASLRRPLIAGALVCLAFFGGLGAWSALAPLATAALGPGVVSPDGNRRTVQHLEGGIVRQLLVQDGSHVEAGDTLIVLDDKAARAARDLALGDLRQLLAVEGRLLAERAGEGEPRIAEQLRGHAAEPEVAALLTAQRELMQQRRAALEQRRTLLQQRSAQVDDEIAGLRAQIAGQTRQLALIAEEVKGVNTLLEKGLERRPRLLALQRAQAEIVGARGANEAAIARALQTIAETDVQISTMESQRQEEISTQLADVTGQIAAARDKLAAAEDVLRRTVVIAPVAGTVVQMKARTIGGIVGAGQPILDIVPRDDELLIEAHIAPNDIDIVHEGLPARVVLSAYKLRNQPRIEGRVRSVSADRIVEPNSSKPYYLVRVEVDRAQLARLAPDIELTPGMPAEVMVMAGTRTALGYLTQPLIDSLRQSMNES